MVMIICIGIHNIIIVHRLLSSFVSSVSGLDYSIELCKRLVHTLIVVSVVRGIHDAAQDFQEGLHM